MDYGIYLSFQLGLVIVILLALLGGDKNKTIFHRIFLGLFLIGKL